jgi:hypothetical protein
MPRENWESMAFHSSSPLGGSMSCDGVEMEQGKIGGKGYLLAMQEYFAAHSL